MVMSVGFVRKLKFLVILISIGIVFGVVYVGFTLTNVEDINMVSKIYSNEQYSEAMYSGNTKERAQHLIEIEEGTWKQGCEKNNECFLPYVETIKIGDVVLFVNEDEYEHNIRVRGESEYLHFPADVINPDEYFVYKFAYSGEFDYYCTLHPWMDGKVIVE